MTTLEQKQEPVAWLTDRENMYFDKEDAWRDCDGFIQPLYTEPPKRKWLGLTDKEIRSMTRDETLVRYFESVLKGKNT